MSYVLQEWMEDLSWKKQTVLIGAIRSPDTISTLKIKQVVIWIRAVVLRNADPLTGFMHGALRQGLPLFAHMDREYERLSLHAAHHIMLAMQVIGNEHPDDEISGQARHFYYALVEAQHLEPEYQAKYDERMADNPNRLTEGMS